MKIIKKRRLMLGLLPLLLSGCLGNGMAAGFLQAPSVSLLSLTPKGIQNGQLYFDLGLQVMNPNPLPLPIDDIQSSIALNGLSLISATGKPANMIPANGSEAVTLSANVGMAQVQQLISTLNSPQVSYQINGNIGILGQAARLPFQQSGQLNTVDLATQLLRYGL